MTRGFAVASGFALSTAILGVGLLVIADWAAGRPSNDEGGMVGGVLFAAMAYGWLAIAGGFGVWIVAGIFHRWFLGLSTREAMAIGAVLGFLVVACAGFGLMRHVPALLGGVIAGLVLVAAASAVRTIHAKMT
jgi:hypothetical protein